MPLEAEQIHFPDAIGVGDIVTFEGELPCTICDLPMNQGHVDRGELMAITGKADGRKKPAKAYVAHVAHFFQMNPATGEVQPKEDYYHNMRIMALAYAQGEKLLREDKGPVM